MKTVIPDTNILVRILVNDNEEYYKKAVKLFKSAESGKIKILILPVVVAETCFVLGSVYKKTDEEIAEAFEGLLSPNWLEIEHKDALRGVWQWFKLGIHFVDSYLLSLSKNERYEFISFDKQLMKRLG